MRRNALVLLTLLALAAGVLPSTAAPGVGGFMSSNISHVLQLISDSPGVGARVHVMPDGERRFYVSSIQGLRIYNIDDPALPVPIGVFEIPNWENEDVSVSKDGKTVLMSEFMGMGYTYVFTVSDPVGPAGTVTITLADALPLSAAHIVDCIDDACDYFYGSEGQIWDARDKTLGGVVQLDRGWAQALSEQGVNVGSGHNLEVVGDRDLDGDGDLERVAISDTTPMVMMDVTDPVNPVAITTSHRPDHGQFGTQYQHNNKLFGFADYAPRAEDDPYVPYDPEIPGSGFRRGEILLGNGETNFTVQCDGGNGPLTSWSAVGWEQGEQFRAQHVMRPVNGEYDGPDETGGNPAVNAMGCSGHWFDVRQDDTNPDDLIVAAAWYEHGTRVFRVNGKTAEISQVGFFQPVQGSNSAAHWVVDDSGIFIFTVDYQRGVDILRYDPAAPAEDESTLEASWFLASPESTRIAERQRALCALSNERNPTLLGL